jgi:hypothetical protein
LLGTRRTAGPKVRATVLYDASWVLDAAESAEYRELRTAVERLLDQGRDAAALRRFLAASGCRRPSSRCFA